MQRITILALKAVLAFAFLVCLFGEVLVIPLFANEVVGEFPEVGYLRLPGIVGSIAIVMCVQAALVGIWVLLSMVAKDAIFRPSAFRVVDVLIGCGIAQAVLFIAAFIVLSVAGATTPGAMILIIVGTAASGGVALLLQVMKGLLRKAVELQSEMAEVI
ncbi:MAG: DUF2975 domain-containing protein [Microbacterium sp.]